MAPQNNYTLKHNSLTKSSSWRGAHWLLAYGKYEWPPYYSNKPKANKELRFQNSHCGVRAVSKTHSDKVRPSNFFAGKCLRKWNPATQTWRSLTREHYKQHRHPHPRCVSPSPHLHQFRHDLKQQVVLKLHPDSLCRSPQQRSLQGHMDVDENGKMSSGRTYNLLKICFRQNDLLMQNHTFLRHSIEKQHLTINWWIYMPESLTTYSL